MCIRFRKPTQSQYLCGFHLTRSDSRLCNDFLLYQIIKQKQGGGGFSSVPGRPP
ncbi:hypothetical protein EDWATA_03003 [Edwardsiella tarda ATCC 23685]|uniref:Uncharacterized protein n=1 Tax=Edwardsiella tarda ATCC 23685 TaxID=500638 RepID=D4F8B6_EDWTA|nr:hypothetical protein EDWATA_03003 [Edwardsiella tarda ATCC 23685]